MLRRTFAASSLAIIVASLAAPCANAITIETKESSDKSVTTIMLTGRMDAGDGMKLRAFVSGIPGSKPIVAWLAFSGGVRSEAMSIGRFFHQAGVRTVLPKDARCISPCPLVLVAGRDPVTKMSSYVKNSSARLGFSGMTFNYPDKPYTAQDLDAAVASTQRDILQIADYLQAVGAKQDLLRYYQSVLKPDEIRYLTNEEVLDLGIPVLVEETGNVIAPYGVQRN